LESHVKVIFGMMVLGVFSGMLLQQLQRIEEYNFLAQSKKHTTVLKGKRESITSDLVVLITLLVVTLTVVLSMIALKDLYWLEAHKNNYLDGSGHISIIKEFLFVGLVMLGYTLVIIKLASKAVKQVLDDNEVTLSLVAAGDLDSRLTLVRHDELGVLSYLTNEMLEALKNSFIEVQYTRDTAILGLSALAESRDNETGAHIIRTQQYVKALAVYLSETDKYRALLTPEYIELLYKSAPLHDVGKVGIPDNILLKPGKLSQEEFEIMKQHAQIGADALSSAESKLGDNSFLRLAKEIALTHHEKWDGSGYPAQLKGEEIPLSGRLMALGDVYDALISKRVYKPAFSHEKAKSIILEGNGLHFDPNVIEAFLAVEGQFKQIADYHQDSGLKA
jgi:response regulator RpfG family c-di-GMP phosphodiesterase